MLKRHVIAAHATEEMPPGSGYRRPSTMTTTTASSPEDGREEGDEPESSHMRPASTTASWSSQGVSRGEPPPVPSSSYESNHNYQPPASIVPNYASLVNPAAYPNAYPPPSPQNQAPYAIHSSSYDPSSAHYIPQPQGYSSGLTPFLSSSVSTPKPYDPNDPSQYSYVPHLQGGSLAGPSQPYLPHLSYQAFDSTGALTPNSYAALMSPNARTGGNLDWSELQGQRTWEGVDESWIAHALGTTDGLDWDGGMNERPSEKVAPSFVGGPPPLPPLPPTMAYTNSTSAPSSIYPIQPPPSPPSLSYSNHGGSSSSTDTGQSNHSTPPSTFPTPVASSSSKQSYAHSLLSFNKAVLSTLPVMAKAPLLSPATLHYQSHPHLYVASHFGVPPPANSPLKDFGIEGDNHHQFVEGRNSSPSHATPPNTTSKLSVGSSPPPSMTIFERRNLKKAMVELDVGMDGSVVGARKGGIRNETEGSQGVPMGRSFSLETTGMHAARDRVTDGGGGVGAPGLGAAIAMGLVGGGEVKASA